LPPADYCKAQLSRNSIDRRDDPKDQQNNKGDLVEINSLQSCAARSSRERSLFTATSGLISQLINVHAAAWRSGVLPLAWISETPPIRAVLRARALTKTRICRAIAYRRVEKGVVIRSLTQARGGVVNGEDERGRP